MLALLMMYDFIPLAFSEFEIQRLVRESSGLPVDLGEDSYTLSVWAKPSKLSSVMDYKFATGWYEGAGGEYMQAKLSPGRVDISEYNSMFTINPTDSDQKSVFPYGLSEKIFDGSFGDNKINDIDGRGWRLGRMYQTVKLLRLQMQTFRF